MKKTKFILLFVVLILCFQLASIAAFAEEKTVQDGLELSIVTDKENYSASDQINVTVL